MINQIIFEQPLNEKCRTLLRLSHLFEQMDFHLPHKEEWHARAALRALLDIATVLTRADIKSELLKEMDRYTVSLSRMANTPGVDTDRLKHILQNLQQSAHALQVIHGQLGNNLRKNDFLNGILQRASIAGGGFDFDLPQFHYWLNLPHGDRLLQLDDWKSEISPVQESVELLLSLIRSSTRAQMQRAENGFYQHNLPSGSKAEMIRVGLPMDQNLFAEISGGKHRFSIRFMETQEWEHPSQSELDIPFELSICMI